MGEKKYRIRFPVRLRFILGFFPAFPKGSVGGWSKTSQMTGWRQMPFTDGNTLHWASRPRGVPANLRQPCSQQEQIPERRMARGIRIKRDFQHDGDTVAINQQEAAAPRQHERKPGSTSLPVWEPPVTYEWEADLLPGSRPICITSLQNRGDEIRGVWD